MLHFNITNNPDTNTWLIMCKHRFQNLKIQLNIVFKYTCLYNNLFSIYIFFIES